MRRLLSLVLLLLSFASVASSNDFYSHGSFPTTGSAATSAAMRAELDLISAGFDKLPALSGNASRLVVVNGSGTGLTTTTGTFLLGGNFTITGAFATTLTVTADTTLTLPTTGTLATLSGVETFSNKSLSSPVVAGTVTGSYILGGTPTITSPTITSPTITSPTVTSPTINTSFAGTAVLGVTQGGLGSLATPSNGQIPIGNGSTYTTATLTAGSGVLIGNAPGQITLWSQCATRVVGLTGANSAGAPTLHYDLSANAVTFRDVNGACAVVFNTGTVTNDVSVSGPTANGRDQAGAFSASSWVHLYFIWNGATVASLSSATAPPTGPALPPGYTQWAYAGPQYFDGSSHLVRTHQRGSWVNYDAIVTVLNSGTATSWTAVGLTASVPPNALMVRLESQSAVIPNAAIASSQLQLGFLSGSLYANGSIAYNPTTSSAQMVGFGHVEMPVVSQQMYYQLQSSGTITSQTGNLLVLGFSVPNGGE